MSPFPTPNHLDYHPLSEYPNGVYPSDEDIGAVVEIVEQFRRSLVTAPEEFWDIYWIQCTFEALKWDGLGEKDSRDRVPPAPIAWIDFDDVGIDRLGSADPKGLHAIMFEGEKIDVAIQPLFMALHWERDRVRNGLRVERTRQRNGERGSFHLEQINKYMVKAVDGIESLCDEIELDLPSA